MSEENTQFYGRFDDDPSNTRKPYAAQSDSAGYSIAKVFGYMAIFILVTAVITIGLGLGLNYWIMSATTDEEYANIGQTIIILLIVSGIGLLVTTIVSQVVFLKGKHSVVVPAVIYAALMGIVLGLVAALINNWAILGITFAITAGVFGIMALIGLLSKGRLTALGLIGFGLMFGAMFISLFMVIIMIFFPALYEWYYWIVSFMMFAAVMFMTIFDISHIKQLAANGALNNNLSMYLAFNLYVDFIYLFMRILLIVIRIFGRRN